MKRTRLGKKFKVIVQAKHYAESNNVGEPAVRDLIGTVKLQSADQGILFTTSSFTAGAQAAAFSAGNIKLVDGAKMHEWLKSVDLLFDPLQFESMLEICTAQVDRNTAVFQGDIQKLDKKFIPQLYVARKDGETFIKNFVRQSKEYESKLSEYKNSVGQYEEKRLTFEKEMNDYINKWNKATIEERETLETLKPHAPPKPVMPKVFNCTAIVGEAGIGKTNLFCHLCKKQLKSKNLTLFFAGHQITSNIVDEVLADLSSFFRSKLTPEALILGLDKILSVNESFLFIFVDAINESRIYREIGNQLAVFLQRLERLNISRIKILVSCRDIDWAVVISGNYNLLERIYDEKPFYLNKFSPNEMIEVWRLYSTAFNVKNPQWEYLGKKVKDVINQPLMLRFLCEAYQNDYVPNDIERLQIFQRYWERKFKEIDRIGQQLGTEALESEAANSLFKIVDKMRELKQRNSGV